MSCPESKDEDLEDFPSEDDLDYGEGNSSLDEAVETNI